MKKTKRYALLLMLLLLCLGGIQFKALLNSADQLEKETEHEADQLICNAFEESVGKGSAEYATTQCQKLGNRRFEMLTTKEMGHLGGLVDQKLGSIEKFQISYLLNIEESLSAQSGQAQEYRRASVELSLPSKTQFVIGSLTGDRLFSLALTVAIFLVGHQIFKSFKNDRRHESDIAGKNGVFSIGSYTFNAHNQQLIYGDSVRRITRKETQLLKCLVRNKNIVVQRDEILIALWGESDYFTSRSLDVFMAKLRNYLSQDKSLIIETVYGVGFVLKETQGQ